LECAKAKGVHMCCDCNDFPCAFLAPMADKADHYPHNIKLYNLCRMKKVGFDCWIEEEAGRIRKKYFTSRLGDNNKANPYNKTDPADRVFTPAADLHKCSEAQYYRFESTKGKKGPIQLYTSPSQHYAGFHPQLGAHRPGCLGSGIRPEQRRDVAGCRSHGRHRYARRAHDIRGLLPQCVPAVNGHISRRPCRRHLLRCRLQRKTRGTIRHLDRRA
jgi:hypothetical protein